MKFLIMAVFLLLVNLHADEITRIESIVKDITKLRIDYDKCQEDLSFSLVKIKDEKDKNEILLRELKTLEKEIESLKNQINKQKNNDTKIITKKIIVKEKIEIPMKNQIIEKNEFPQLQMKNKHPESKVIDTRAQTYRLKTSAKIYDAIEGNVLEEWEEQTSFTSNYKVGRWIKITGYFVDKVWEKSPKEMWVKEDKTKQREGK